MLAAFGLGDIGLLFPDTDPKWRGARSEVFLREALRLVEERGGRLIQVSLAIILDQPKLSPHRQGLLENLSRLLGLPLDRIGLTFKTSEGLAVAHVQARAMVLLDG